MSGAPSNSAAELRHFTGLIEDPLSTFLSDQQDNLLYREPSDCSSPASGGGEPCAAWWRGRTSSAPSGSLRSPPPPRSGGGTAPSAPRNDDGRLAVEHCRHALD